ncbi:unnamed protein product, partial [Ectocarpus sp. 12 AP-2014]
CAICWGRVQCAQTRPTIASACVCIFFNKPLSFNTTIRQERTAVTLSCTLRRRRRRCRQPFSSVRYPDAQNTQTYFATDEDKTTTSQNVRTKLSERAGLGSNGGVPKRSSMYPKHRNAPPNRKPTKQQQTHL